MPREVYQCKKCNATHHSVLTDTGLVVCRNCGAIIFSKIDGSDLPEPGTVPPDWSFVQLGTTGEYNGNPFTVAGRVRLQLRNDYKNFWSCAFANGKMMWMMESFASFSMLTPEWLRFDRDVRYLHAAELIALPGGTNITGDYVEKCEGISCEGETGDWRLFSRGFFFIQASNMKGETAVFTVKIGDGIEYLTGQTLEWQKLNLKNILEWDEWK